MKIYIQGVLCSTETVNWKPLKCPSTSYWIGDELNKLEHIHIMEYYITIEKSNVHVYMSGCT